MSSSDPTGGATTPAVQQHDAMYRQPATAAHCPRWENLGHNWIVIKGWLPWRRYRVCCACNHEERIE